jgi:hypothetical protein
VGGFLGDMAEGAWGSFSGFVGTLWDIIPIQAIWDPNTGTFRPGEAETGLRVEEQRGITLERAPLQQGPDWIGSDGKTYDAVGNFPAKYFDQQWKQLQRRIDQHLNKADYVPVDVSQFTPAQVARVRDFVEPLGQRVFIVGG